jgi:hypothetical protein
MKNLYLVILVCVNEEAPEENSTYHRIVESETDLRKESDEMLYPLFSYNREDDKFNEKDLIPNIESHGIAVTKIEPFVWETMRPKIEEALK